MNILKEKPDTKRPVIIPAATSLFARGRAEVRRCYEASFASFPDGRCQLRLCTGNRGRAVAESRFLGTRRRDGDVVEAIGGAVLLRRHTLAQHLERSLLMGIEIDVARHVVHAVEHHLARRIVPVAAL